MNVFLKNLSFWEIYLQMKYSITWEGNKIGILFKNSFFFLSKISGLVLWAKFLIRKIGKTNKKVLH